MAKFEIGETIICSITIKNSADVLVDPATSIKITIEDEDGVKVVDDIAMTNDGVGLDHYDYTSALTVKAGPYTIWYIAIDGARTTKQKDSFELEA